MNEKKRIALVPLFLILGLTAFVIAAAVQVHTTATAAAAGTSKPLIILDAGHGGIDGGAVSDSGIVEKDINLAIAIDLRDLLESSGFQVLMTRESDVSIHDENATTVRQIKVSDIHNRLKIMQEHPGCIFISIHQNHYTQSQYHGAQCFYSTAKPSSKELAAQLQLAFQEKLQPDNTREIKPSGSEIYLMYHADTTAVLAECGFLSNPGEAAKLGTSEYQRQVAFTLFTGLVDYLAAVSG